MRGTLDESGGRDTKGSAKGEAAPRRPECKCGAAQARVCELSHLGRDELLSNSGLCARYWSSKPEPAVLDHDLVELARLHEALWSLGVRGGIGSDCGGGGGDGGGSGAAAVTAGWRAASAAAWLQAPNTELRGAL